MLYYLYTCCFILYNMTCFIIWTIWCTFISIIYSIINRINLCNISLIIIHNIIGLLFILKVIYIFASLYNYSYHFCIIIRFIIFMNINVIVCILVYNIFLAIIYISMWTVICITSILLFVSLLYYSY